MTEVYQDIMNQLMKVQISLIDQQEMDSAEFAQVVSEVRNLVTRLGSIECKRLEGLLDDAPAPPAKRIISEDVRFGGGDG